MTAVDAAALVVIVTPECARSLHRAADSASVSAMENEITTVGNRNVEEHGITLGVAGLSLVQLYCYKEKPDFGDQLNPWLWPNLFLACSVTAGVHCFSALARFLNEVVPPEAYKVVFGSGFGPPTNINDSKWSVYEDPRTVGAVGLPRRPWATAHGPRRKPVMPSSQTRPRQRKPMKSAADQAFRLPNPTHTVQAHEDRTKVFVVGCPRSGTTWLQLLLEQHPAVASENETHIFAWYVPPLLRAWEVNRENYPVTGLCDLMTEAEFWELIKGFVEASLAKFLKRNPDAKVLVEKSPWHLMHYEVILRLFPDARFVHIIRDPRSVAASLKAAHTTGWGGRTWAPKRVDGAARLWTRAMRLRKAVAAATGNYREVRYEDLKADAASELAALFEWIGLPATPELCAQAVENCRIGKLQNSTSTTLSRRIGRKNRTAFYRRGEVAGWKDELSPDEIKSIEFMTGDLMREVGYECWAPPKVMPVSLRWYLGKRRVRHAIAPYARAFAHRMAR